MVLGPDRIDEADCEDESAETEENPEDPLGPVSPVLGDVTEAMEGALKKDEQNKIFLVALATFPYVMRAGIRNWNMLENQVPILVRDLFLARFHGLLRCVSRMVST